MANDISLTLQDPDWLSVRTPSGLSPQIGATAAQALQQATAQGSKTFKVPDQFGQLELPPVVIEAGKITNEECAQVFRTFMREEVCPVRTIPLDSMSMRGNLMLCFFLLYHTYFAFLQSIGDL